MKSKIIILSALIVAAFAISPAYATESSSSSGHGGASDHDRDPSGADRDGGGERNFDRDNEDYEGTPIEEVGIGEPTDPDSSYIQSRELLRDRH